jgi:hypothetical protein
MANIVPFFLVTGMVWSLVDQVILRGMSGIRIRVNQVRSAGRYESVRARGVEETNLEIVGVMSGLNDIRPLNSCSPVPFLSR